MVRKAKNLQLGIASLLVVEIITIIIVVAASVGGYFWVKKSQQAQNFQIEEIKQGAVDDKSIDIKKLQDKVFLSAQTSEGTIVAAEVQEAIITTNSLSNGTFVVKFLDGQNAVIDISEGVISEFYLADGSVTTAKIVDLAVTTAKLADGSVTEVKIIDGAITSGKIADGTITAQDLATGSIITATIADGAVTTSKIADNAVTQDKLGSSSVTESKIADSAITNSKISNLSITAAKIATGTITGTQIASDGSVMKSLIAGSEITVTNNNDGSWTIADSSGGEGDVVLAPTTAQTDATTRSMINLNKTGATGNLLQMAVNGTDTFVINHSGIITTGIWQGTTIANGYIATALSGKTYEGLTLTSNADGFAVQGGTTSRTLTITGANVGINQSLQTTDSPTFVTITGTTLTDGTASITGGAMTGATYNGLTITTAANTFNLTRGTSSLDVATGKAVDINMNLTVNTANVTLNQSLQTSDSVTFNGLSNSDANITNVGNIALDSISADATDIDINITDPSATALQISDGTTTYLTFDSTAAAEKIEVGATLDLSNTIDMTYNDGATALITNGVIQATAVEDKFLRNDGDDTTTGIVTMDSLKIQDTNDTHTLNFVWNENEATANRTLNFLVNGGDRSLSLSGNLTVESASLLNQDLTSDASPTFAGATLTAFSGAVQATAGVLSAGTLPVNIGGTGQTTYTNGQLLIGNTTGNTLSVGTLTGTANQITVTNGTGTITLSTPQDIGTASSPTFASPTVTNLHIIDATTAFDLMVASDSTTAFTADHTITVDLNNADRTFALQGNLTVESASILNQDLTTDASPTFAGMTLTAFSGAVQATAGVLSAGTLPVNIGGTGQTTYTNGQLLIGNTTGNTLSVGTLTGTANQITVTNGTGTITLSTPQDIGTASSPTFATPTVSNLTVSNQGILKLYEATGGGTNYVGLQAAAALASDLTYTLPSAAPGADGYVLSSTTLGVMSWIVQGGSTWTDGGAYLYPTNRESVRVYDAGGTDYIDIAHDGTDATISFANTTALNLNIGTLDLSAQTVDVTLNSAVDALNFDSNTLSIDAANNRVGIGDAAPLQTLSLKNATGIDPLRIYYQSSASDWYDANWTYRKPITITNSGSTATNFQTEIQIDAASLILAGKMKSDGSDIRITTSDGLTELNHWYDSTNINSATGKIWVKIPSLPNGDTTVYLYYGYASASVSSYFSGTNTFEFFDDFDDGSINAQWTTTTAGSGTVTEHDGLLDVNNPASSTAYIYSNAYTINPTSTFYIVTSRSNYVSGNDWTGGIVLHYDNNNFTDVFYNSNETRNSRKYIAGSSTNGTEVNPGTGYSNGEIQINTGQIRNYVNTTLSLDWTAYTVNQNHKILIGKFDGEGGSYNNRLYTQWVNVRKYNASVSSSVGAEAGSTQEYLYVASTGNTGIGQANPTAKLEVEVGSTDGVTGLLVDADDVDQIAMQIQGSQTTADVIDILADSVTTAYAIDISTDALTTGSAINITSTSTAGTGSDSTEMINIARSGANSNASHTAYGLYSSVTNTGTTSTNVAGYFNASGATNNYAAVFNAGNVGIGDTTPSYKLDILDSGAITADNRTLNVSNTQTSSTASVDIFGGYFSASGVNSGTGAASVGLYSESTGDSPTAYGTNYGLFGYATGGNNANIAVRGNAVSGSGDAGPRGGFFTADAGSTATEARAIEGGASGGSATSKYGGYFYASQGGTVNYGILADAHDAATNYGIYASVSGAGTNYAGYFSGPLATSDHGGSFHVYDVAELIPSAFDVEKSDLVVANSNSYRQATKAVGEYNPSIIGVIPEKPWFTIGDKNKANEENPEKNYQYLTIAGQTLVKVDTYNGAIQPGDPLASSNNPGYAMKATKQGSIVGVALQSLDSGTGKILALINLSYYNPTNGDSLQGTDQISASLINSNNNEDVVIEPGSGKTKIIGELIVTDKIVTRDIEIKGHIIGNHDTRGTVAIPAGEMETEFVFDTPYLLDPSVVASPVTKGVLYHIEIERESFKIKLEEPADIDLEFSWMAEQ